MLTGKKEATGRMTVNEVTIANVHRHSGRQNVMARFSIREVNPELTEPAAKAASNNLTDQLRAILKF